MKSRSPFSLFAALASYVILSSLTFAAPRDWTDQATGRKISAEYLSSDGTEVTVSMNGKEFKLPIAKLSSEDQAYIKMVASPASAPTATTAPAAVAKAPAAKIVGPLEAQGSHYYYYVPSSLKEGGKAPLIFFTGSGGGSSSSVKRLAEGAEVSGWIVGCSVESKNGMPDAECAAHTDHCVAALIQSLPIDPKQVYFTGNSGGARVAFTNSKRVESAGVLAMIAGAKKEELSRSKRYFMISGSRDYNRYDTSVSFAEVRSVAAFRFHPGKHEDGPDWLVTEGVVWLQQAWFDKQKSGAPERATYEESASAWVEGLSVKTPDRAAWWAKFFSQKMVGPAKTKMLALDTKLAATPANASYVKAISELEEFAAKVFGSLDIGSVDNHTTPEIQRKAKAIFDAHQDDPWIAEVTTELQKPTIGPGKK